jgi:hypothetical protein
MWDAGLLGKIVCFPKSGILLPKNEPLANPLLVAFRIDWARLFIVVL